MDSQTTYDYIQNFFGYGNLKAPYWFIGKEEGGGKDAEENIRRISLWKEMGSPTTNDMYDFHIRLGFTNHQLSRLQQTWSKIAQMLNVIETGNDFELVEEKRSYLINRLGRHSSNNCLLELMPIPARSTGKDRWLGKDISEAPELKDKDEYMRLFVGTRINSLRNLVKTHNPRLVVFYSVQVNYICWWSQIADSNAWWWENLGGKMKMGYQKTQGKLFVVTPHPTMKGVKNSDFRLVGNKIRDEMQ